MWVLVIMFGIVGVNSPAVEVTHPFEFDSEETCKIFVTEQQWGINAEEGFQVAPDCRKVSENV